LRNCSKAANDFSARLNSKSRDLSHG